MKLPEHITSTWIDSLADADLLAAESQLHAAFVTAERAEKDRRGAEYSLVRGPSELLDVWGRWSRLSAETRARGLHARRRPAR